jgi:hypothetical protein
VSESGFFPFKTIKFINDPNPKPEPMLDQYYSILEVSPEASVQEIKKAYWRLAKKWHPDINTSEEAAGMFIRIHQAYDILVNGKLPAESVVYTPAYSDSSEDRHYRYKSAYDSYQERAAAFARLQYEEFKRNNELFKQSFWYWPAKAFTYFAWLVGNLAGLICLFFPIWVVFFLKHTGAGITLIPFSLLGIAVMAAAFRFKEEVVERYF